MVRVSSSSPWRSPCHPWSHLYILSLSRVFSSLPHDPTIARAKFASVESSHGPLLLGPSWLRDLDTGLQLNYARRGINQACANLVEDGRFLWELLPWGIVTATASCHERHGVRPDCVFVLLSCPANLLMLQGTLAILFCLYVITYKYND